VSDAAAFTARLLDQTDPAIGQERIQVSFSDGRTEELFLHDYERLYSLPGLYEQIVHDRLGCRSPQVIAERLASAVDGAGWDRAEVRVIDIAAGNGVSGQALAEAGLDPVLGTDIVPAARAAALRDRPGLYGSYLVLDLLNLTGEQAELVRAQQASALAAVAVVGEHPGQLPRRALAAAARLLEPDAILAYMHDPGAGEPDSITPEFWSEQLGSPARAQEIERERYVHRHTVTGWPFELDRVLWRITRAAA
jgi:hypothetical protein